MATAVSTAATAATALVASGAAADLSPTEAVSAGDRARGTTTTVKSPDGLPAVPGRWRFVARDGTSTIYRVTEHRGTLYVCDGCRMALAVPLRNLDGDWFPLEITGR